MSFPFNLNGYENLIRSIKNLGWTISSFDSALQKQKSLALRHDIDAELYLLEAFLEIERRMEIQATYFLMLESPFYNLGSPEGRRMLKTITNGGHSVGLHFFGELYSNLVIDQLIMEIHKQLELLSSLTETPVKAYSFHQPTREMINADLAIPGVINTYHSKTMERLTYITDTNMDWRPHLLEIALANPADSIQMLIHPLWWISEGKTPLAKWRSVLRSISEIHANHLIGRERTLSELAVSDLQIPN